MKALLILLLFTTISCLKKKHPMQAAGELSTKTLLISLNTKIAISCLDKRLPSEQEVQEIVRQMSSDQIKFSLKEIKRTNMFLCSLEAQLHSKWDIEGKTIKSEHKMTFPLEEADKIRLGLKKKK